MTFGMISWAEMPFLVTRKYNRMMVKLSKALVSCFSFDFSVSLPEVQRRTLDVAVKNSGGFLSKDKGLLGKVSAKQISDQFLWFVKLNIYLQCSVETISV